MRYLLLSGNKGQYCSAVFEKVVNGVRYRDKLYLGKIVDRLGKDRVVVYSSKRGHFVYNLKDEVFETLPDDYVCPSVHKPNKIENFGDGYLLYHYIFKTKFIEVINSLYFENKDTLIVLIIAAMLGITSSIDIANWYNNNFIKHLCPKAVVESQRISDSYRKLGSAAELMELHGAYSDYLFKTCNMDRDFIIDSVGYNNDINIHLTQFCNHNNISSHCCRMVLVSNSLGIPVYYRLIPGNINDQVTLGPTLRHLRALEIPFDSFVFDAGYFSFKNISLFYDSDHKSIAHYITRVKSNSTLISNALNNDYLSIKRPDNIYRYKNKYYHILEKEVFVGEGNLAYLYVVYDNDNYCKTSNELMRKAEKNNYTQEEYFEKEKRLGIFGLITDEKIGCEKVLKSYLFRTNIETVFDLSKNYTGIDPLRVHNESTLRGCVLVNYMGLCLLKMLQIELKSNDLSLKTSISNLKYQHCTVYKNIAVVEDAEPNTTKVYNTLGIELPGEVALTNGIASVATSDSNEMPKWAEIANKNHPNSKDGFLESKAERKDRKAAANRKQFAKRANEDADVKQNQSSRKVIPPCDVKGGHAGRPKGSRNKISVEREKFISLLLKIREQKAYEAGVSDEELHDIDQNLGQKRSVRTGRKPGSRNVKTIERERLNTKTEAHLDRVCEELGISKEELGELRRKEVQKLSEPEQPRKPGRKKGVKSIKTVLRELLKRTTGELIASRSMEFAITETEYRQLLLSSYK